MARPGLHVVRDDLVDIGCVAVTAAVALLVATNQRDALRAGAGVVFAIFVPGWSIVSNWPGLAARSRLAASLLLSISILTLVATLSLWAGYWRPLGLLEVECVVVEAALCTALYRRARSARATPKTADATHDAPDLHDLDS
jgi:uncharacterized membrane protein